MDRDSFRRSEHWPEFSDFEPVLERIMGRSYPTTCHDRCRTLTFLRGNHAFCLIFQDVMNSSGFRLPEGSRIGSLLAFLIAGLVLAEAACSTHSVTSRSQTALEAIDVELRFSTSRGNGLREKAVYHVATTPVIAVVRDPES
jgi:hypothetical protein